MSFIDEEKMGFNVGGGGVAIGGRKRSPMVVLVLKMIMYNINYSNKYKFD